MKISSRWWQDLLMRMTLVAALLSPACASSAAQSPGKVITLQVSRHRTKGPLRGGDAAFSGKTRPGRSDAELTVPLQTDQTLYLATIQLGTPPQYLRVQMDTGSDLLWVLCRCVQPSDSNGCVPGVKVFNDKQSTSFSAITCKDPYCKIPAVQRILEADPQCGNASHVGQLCKSYGNAALDFCPGAAPQQQLCNFQYSYADGSGTAGFLAEESLQFGCGQQGSKAINIAFGCAQYPFHGPRFNSTLDSSTDGGLISGLIGLGPASGVLSGLYKAGVIDHWTLSHCLAPSPTEGGGSFMFGIQPGTSGGRGSVVRAQLIGEQVYGLDLEDILVGGNKLYSLRLTAGAERPLYLELGRLAKDGSLAVSGFLTDTGSTITSLPITLQKVFIQMLKETVPLGFTYLPELSQKYTSTIGFEVPCWQRTDPQLSPEALPPVSLLMHASKGVLQLPNYSVYEQVDDGAGTGGNPTWCVRVSSVPDSNLAIIGEHWLWDLMVTHDLANGTSTFQRANCSVLGEKLQNTSFPTTCSGVQDTGNAFNLTSGPPSSPGTNPSAAPKLASGHAHHSVSFQTWAMLAVMIGASLFFC